jgi:energy-coupling factor transport system substrate-specific component
MDMQKQRTIVCRGWLLASVSITVPGSLSSSGAQYFPGSSQPATAKQTRTSNGNTVTPERKHEKVNMWKIGKSELIAIAVGSVLYGTLGQFETFLQFQSIIPFSFTIFPAIVVPLFFGAVFGPWVGLFAEVGGYLIEHYISGYPFTWQDNLGLAVMGYITGLAILYTRRRYNHAHAIITATIISAIGLIIGITCNLCSRIVFLKTSVQIASNIFITSGLSDLVLCLILLPILLVIYNAIGERMRRT